MWLFAVLLVSASCSRDRIGAEDPVLEVVVRIPRLEMSSRASIGDVKAELAAEASLGTGLKIWVFLHDDFDSKRKSGYCLGYLVPSNQNADAQTGYENRYYMKFKTTDRDIAMAHPYVDVYVLANGGSVGYGGYDEKTTRETLASALIKGTYFGFNNDGDKVTPVQKSPTNFSLPFSAVGIDMPMKGNYPVLNLETLTLKRAVSKLRFVFSQLSDEAGSIMDFTIDELTLDSRLIPAGEFLFNDSTDPYKIEGEGNDASYQEALINFTPPTHEQVAQIQDPGVYAFSSGMSAQDYETLVLEGIAKGDLFDAGRFYLRETDRPLKGKIKYTISGIQSEKTFQMTSPGDFARNHSWIVYFYFLRDHMDFTVAWTDWTDGKDFVLR